MAERPDPDTNPNTLADRLDDLANDRRWDCWNQHGGGSLDVPEGYDPSPDCCDAADGANALRAAADGLRQLADENRALREQLDAAQLRSIEARNPGIDMEEVRRMRLAYPDHERHETVSRAKYGASLAADADAAADRGDTDGEAT